MKRLHDYFAQAATQRRSVSQQELREFVSAQAAAAETGTKLSAWKGRLLLLAIAGGAAIGGLLLASGRFTLFNHHEEEENVRAGNESSGRAAVIEGHGCPLSEFAGGTNGGSSRISPSALVALPMLELAPDELAALGITASAGGGVTLYSAARGEDYVERDELRPDDGAFPEAPPAGTAPAGVRPLPFYPRLITDDLGRLRRFYYTYDEIDSRIQDSIIMVRQRFRYLSESGREKEALDSMNAHPRFGEWFRQLHERSRSLIDFNRLLPVLIRSGHSYTSRDSLAGHCRPDVIIWFEPTPELLARLPSDWRGRMIPRPTVPATDAFPDTEGISSLHSPVDLSDNGREERNKKSTEEPPQQPKPQAGFDRAAEGRKGTEEKSAGRTQPARKEPGMRPGPGEPGPPPDPGGGVEALLLSNPASDGMGVLRLRLHEPRTTAVSLHDITGNRRTILVADRKLEAGEHLISLFFQGIPPGIYLLAVGTDKGELAIERVVLK